MGSIHAFVSIHEVMELDLLVKIPSMRFAQETNYSLLLSLFEFKTIDVALLSDGIILRSRRISDIWKRLSCTSISFSAEIVHFLTEVSHTSVNDSQLVLGIDALKTKLVDIDLHDMGVPPRWWLDQIRSFLGPFLSTSWHKFIFNK